MEMIDYGVFIWLGVTGLFILYRGLATLFKDESGDDDPPTHI